MNELFKFVEENNLSSAVIKPAISLLCGRDVSSEIKNVFNLKNSIKNFLKKSHDHHYKVYMKLYNNDNVVVPVVGDYCSGLGIDLNTIHLCLKEETHKNFELNNGAVLELEDVKHKEKLTWQAFSELLFRLSSINFQINSDSAWYYVGALKKTYSNLLRIPVAERGTKLTDFMCSKFLTSSVASTSFRSNSFYSVDEENSASSQVDTLLSASFELEEKVVNISNSLYREKKQNKETNNKFQKLSAKYIKIKKEKELLASATKENICMSKQIKQLKRNNELVNKSLLEEKAKLGKINTRNVNKRLKKRDITIRKLKTEIVEKGKEIAQLKKINASLIKSLKHKSAREASLRTKVWYWKKRAKPNVELINSSKRDLEAHVRFLENENAKLLDQINESSKRRKLSVFENGQYTHGVRMIYEDLLCMGLSTRNIEKCVRLILEKLANVEVGRLPKVTFAKDMFLEARALSQI